MVHITDDIIELAIVAVVKCKTGDPITDKELDAGILVLRMVRSLCKGVGHIDYLMGVEANQTLSMLEGFQDARNRP